MAIYDKVPPYGTFRAPLAVDWLDADRDKVFAVKLNTSGQVVKASGATVATDVVGLIVVRGIQQPYYPGTTPTYRSPKAGEIVDVMKRGEIVEVADADIAGAAVAGAGVYVAAADGSLTHTAASNFHVGHLVDVTRLVVNVQN